MSKFPQWFIDELAFNDDKEKAKQGTLKAKDKVTFLCPIHGEYTQRVEKHIEISSGKPKAKCLKCSYASRGINHKGYSTKLYNYPQWFIDELAFEADKEKAIKGTLKAKDTVTFHCPLHGEYTKKVSERIILSSGEPNHGCKECGRIARAEKVREYRLSVKKSYPQWFIDSLAHEEDKEKAKNGDLVTTEKYDFICSKHGIYNRTIFNQMFSNGTPKRNILCPRCAMSSSQSSTEKEIVTFIRSLHLNSLIVENDRQIIFPQELDIYLPEYNLAIEYNGFFFHKSFPNENRCKTTSYHMNKFRTCEEKGIHLIQIFDFEWDDKIKQQKIKDYISSILLNNKQPIYARDTAIKTIPLSIAKQFLTDTHIDNYGNGNICYGLYQNDTLLSVMVFGNIRYKHKSNEYELYRYATLPNIRIIGGAEKLLSHFIKDYSPSKIVTYSNNSYFTGEVYKRLGFSLVKFCPPNYVWVGKHSIVHREKAQPQKLITQYPDLYEAYKQQTDIRSIENFIMSNLGYFKVYFAGNKRWELAL